MNTAISRTRCVRISPPRLARFFPLWAGALLLATICRSASADPLEGEVLKFLQMPLNGGLPIPGVVLPEDTIPPAPAPFPGHDELSTAWLNEGTQFDYSGTYMADDFSDNFDTPVVHVQWWGSYMNDTQGPVPRFLISFESDVPVDDNNPFSHPGVPLLNQIVTPGAPGPGFFQELAIPTAAGAPETLYQYNAELAIPFDEHADTVYWLKIVALDDHFQNEPDAIQWGWHDRDWGIHDPLASPVPVPGEYDENPASPPVVWHFQDDAVQGGIGINPALEGHLADILQDSVYNPQLYIPGIDVPQELTLPLSKDLAFALYTVPEPGSMPLLGLGSLALVFAAQRRHGDRRQWNSKRKPAV